MIQIHYKAYAKVCGSYENLEGGYTSDALIDMCGGLEENFFLDSRDSQKERDSLWNILCKSRQLKSMNAAYIEPDPYIYEAKLPNGLVRVILTINDKKTNNISRQLFKRDMLIRFLKLLLFTIEIET